MATSTATEQYVYTEQLLPHWQRTIPIAYPKGNRKQRFVPFRLMCEIVGVERKRQLGIVQRDYTSALRTIPYETPAGARPALWIRADECAVWLGKLDPARCKLETADRLEAFRADFREAVERVLFEGPHKPPSQRGMFSSSERMEYVFSCLACGAGHRIIAQNGEATLERYEF